MFFFALPAAASHAEPMHSSFVDHQIPMSSVEGQPLQDNSCHVSPQFCLPSVPCEVHESGRHTCVESESGLDSFGVAICEDTGPGQFCDVQSVSRQQLCRTSGSFQEAKVFTPSFTHSCAVEEGEFPTPPKVSTASSALGLPIPRCTQGPTDDGTPEWGASQQYYPLVKVSGTCKSLKSGIWATPDEHNAQEFLSLEQSHEGSTFEVHETGRHAWEESELSLNSFGAAICEDTGPVQFCGVQSFSRQQFCLASGFFQEAKVFTPRFIHSCAVLEGERPASPQGPAATSALRVQAPCRTQGPNNDGTQEWGASQKHSMSSKVGGTSEKSQSGIWATPDDHNAQEPLSLDQSHEGSDHTCLMAAGVHTRSTRVTEAPIPPIVDNPNLAAQDENPGAPDDPESSDDESTSEENPAWRDFYLYTVHQPPQQVSLNMVSPGLQPRQCARALGWELGQLSAKYQVDPCPQDLLQSHMRAMVVRFHTDPPEQGPLAMVLIDVEFHPPAPSWDAEIIRTAMFIPRVLTNHQLLASLHLLPYCRYAQLPCLVRLQDQRINLDTEVMIHPVDGAYIQIILPPPNLGDDVTSTRCVAMACYQGIEPQFFDIFGILVEEHLMWDMPSPYQVLVVDPPASPEDEDPESAVMIQIVKFHSRKPIEHPSKPRRCPLHAARVSTGASLCTSQRPVQTKESTNSQRSGRQNPEEKKSGWTNKQPASRTREPDKQPAGGTQTPSPHCPSVFVVQAATDFAQVCGGPGVAVSCMSLVVWSGVPHRKVDSQVSRGSDVQGISCSLPGIQATPGDHNAWEHVHFARNPRCSEVHSPSDEGNQVVFICGDPQILLSQALECLGHSRVPPKHSTLDALVPNTSVSLRISRGPAETQEIENSQRTGRQNPEEKRSGMTNKQPACRTREPDNQPAEGPQVPSSKLSQSVPVMPESVEYVGVSGASSIQVSESVAGPKGLPVGVVAPDQVPGLTVGSHAKVCHNPTGATQACAIEATPVAAPSQRTLPPKLQCPSEVCFPMSEVLSPGWFAEPSVYVLQQPTESRSFYFPPGIQATPGDHNAWDSDHDYALQGQCHKISRNNDDDVQSNFSQVASWHQLWGQMWYMRGGVRGASQSSLLSSRLPAKGRVSPNSGHVPLAVIPAKHKIIPYQQKPRVGEASKPGPPPSHPWVIGAINPTGLAGKAQQFKDMPPGIYAVSETHLSQRGQARFREEIHHAKLDMKLFPGFPAPLKKDSIHAVGGKHTGVAFLTSFPTRPIVSGWDQELYATSRIHAASFLVHNTWVAGGICYGYAKEAETSAVQENTNRLLQELSKQVFHGFKGPAFIAGDFNQVPGVLSEVRKWEQSGWKDVQTWAAEVFGVNPGVTCHYTTRKDYIYLSPELQGMLQRCTNSFDRWPDHSSLLGHFDYPQTCPPIPRWDKPAPIEYSEMSPQDIAASECSPAPHHEDPTSQYSAICAQFEQHVHSCLKAKGKNGLQPNQRGRGQTLQRTFRRQICAPVKPARQGDFQPSVHTWSLLHSRWITQCRRLQSYARHVSKGSTTPTAVEHRAALWHSIRKALGFAGGFEAWWGDQATEHPQLFPWVPIEPPAADLAHHMSHQFAQILSNMETQIIKQRVQQAKRRRIEDTNRIFRDVRKPMPVPVSMLVAKATTQVTVIVDEGSVEVEDSNPIQEATVLETRVGPLHVIHIEENQVWFTSPHSLLPGDELAIVELQGQVSDIHEAFLREWTRRWDRHRHLPDDHWDEVLALTQTMLYADSMKLEPLTLERWKRAIQSKKATAATGLDSVARRDLLAFPDALHLQLLDIFRRAEESGQWPAQLLQGAVHSLEKVPGAQNVSQYRPITVMPCAYRIYTSIRSREVLQHLAKVTPPTLLGNIPGKQAVSLWWTMQHRIEQAMYAGDPLTGAVSDLCKAFNHLPRTVTFQIAASMGVHPNILRAWAASTVNLKRHFVVRNSPSAQVTSTTGFVEGCGMSVVGMVLVNTLVHAYMQHQHPEAVFTTYVDNYEIQTASVPQTTQALHTLQRFCDLLDVQLDTQKTYRWASDATGCANLRDIQVTPIKAAKDLGAHIQYTANLTNGTVLEKFRKLPDLWHKLSRSHSPQVQKLKVLRVVAWPRILYSGAIVHIGRAHFDEARAGAFRALGLQKSGANAQVFLALMAPTLSDPEFYALWHAVTQFRRHIPDDLVDLTLSQAAVTPARKRKPGPGGVLITRLEQVCWTYVADGVFCDGEGGKVHIVHSPPQELKSRLARAWHHAVGRRWEHRKGFRGLRYVSPALSQIDTAKYALDDVGFLQVAQTGAFYTADCLQHTGYTDDSRCAKCLAEDSIDHRHWHCPATAASRNEIPVEIRQLISQQAPCTREHGWMPEPLEVRRFKETLSQIADTSTEYMPCAKQSHYDLFCDGSGLDPKSPLSRVVAWGVVVAGKDLQTPHFPLAWGGVPGYWQTVMRAELMAFLSAVQYRVLQNTTFAVWSDCEVIIRRARRIQRGEFIVTSNCSDHDLWTVVQLILPPVSVCTLHHIKSHQNYHDEEPWIQWACSANDMADMVAAQALTMLPPEVLQAQSAASQAVQKAKEVIFHVHAHMVRVARMSVSQVQPTMAPVSRLPDSVTIRWEQIAMIASQQAPEQLRFPKWLKILEWMQWISNPGSPPRWLSWFELLTSFQLFTNEWGVESTSSHNTWQMHRKLAEYDCKQMLRSWSAYILHLLRLQHPGFKPVDGRPSNPRFACWSMGISCEIAQAADQQLCQWMDQTFKDRKISKMSDLYLAEPAAMDCPVPSAPGLSQGLHRYWRGQR